MELRQEVGRLMVVFCRRVSRFICVVILPLAYFACQPNFFHNRLPCSEGGKGKACPEEGERRTIQLEERNARKLHPVWTSS